MLSFWIRIPDPEDPESGSGTLDPGKVQGHCVILYLKYFGEQAEYGNIPAEQTVLLAGTLNAASYGGQSQETCKQQSRLIYISQFK